MDETLLKQLATLRTVVGYLGEKDQYAWWQSSFFTRGSQAFLAPVFGRTQMLAQANGVTAAAALVHDERIGVGHVYHLFRLPEDIEQGIHRALHESELSSRIAALVAGKETALEHLRKRSGSISEAGIGPTRVGNTQALRDLNHWRIVAAQYAQAFDGGIDVYPYFADQA